MSWREILANSTLAPQIPAPKERASRGFEDGERLEDNGARSHDARQPPAVTGESPAQRGIWHFIDDVPPIGPRVLDAMRRGREAAELEGMRVEADEPEWKLPNRIPSGGPNSRSPLIPPGVRMKIETIELEARRLGWPAELLWNADFWSLPRGLAAVLDENDELGEVTPEFIEILKTEHRALRFRKTPVIER